MMTDIVTQMTNSKRTETTRRT